MQTGKRIITTALLSLITVSATHRALPQTPPPGGGASAAVPPVTAAPTPSKKDASKAKATPSKVKSDASKSKAEATQTKAVPTAAEPPAAGAVPAKPKSSLDPPTELLLETGYADWQLSGSRNKFQQYATMPNGFFLRDLYYVPIMASPAEHIFTSFKGIGGADYRGDGSWDLNYGATRITGFFTQNTFFEDTPDPVGASTRKTAGFTLRQALTKNFSLAYRYRDDIQQNRFDSPNAGENQNTQYQDAVASGKLGNGFIKLTTANLKFTDHTGTLSASNTQTMGASYLWTPVEAVDLEAAYSRATIGQPGMQGSRIETVSFTGDVSIGSGTDVNLSMQNRSIGLPNVQNAYVRHQGIESFSISERYKSWRGTINLRLQDDERINDTQSYTDVPKWSTVEGRISGKILRDIRLTVRGYTQALIEQPSFNTLDPSNLYWTSRDFVEGRLEGGRDALTYYLVYTFQSNRNVSRGSEVQTGQYTAGSVWQVNNKLSLYGEFHHEGWSGQDNMVGFPSIGDYLPTTDTGMVQLTYNSNKRAYFSATYTGFSTRNNNPLLLPDGNTSGSFVTINGHYRFPKGYELGFTVAPWTYHDRVVNTMNYTATILMITGSARF